MLSRRNLIKLGAAAGAASLLPLERLGHAFAASELTVPRFAVPLTRPPVLTPVSHRGGVDLYEIKMKLAEADIVPGYKTRIWGYNGIFPGPTIRARKGQPILVRQRNFLAEDMSVHLHGGNVPSSSDGHPTRDLIQPGNSRTFFYPNRQPGTMLFYHDHVHMKEAPHTYNGLQGMYIIEDPRERRLGLPEGKYDVPLAITDRLFAADGQFRWPDGEFTGDVFLVNGKPFPFFKVERRSYRLRLLNSSSIDGVMQLHLEDNSTFHVIGNDGGLLPAPVAVQTLSLWPGERADIVVDFGNYARGAKLKLMNSYTELGLVNEIMRFDVDRNSDGGHDRLPHTLMPVERLKESDAVRTRDVVMKTVLSPSLAMLINGQVFDPNRIDFHTKLGETEIWNLVNDDANFEVPHVFHTHLVRFQILDRDGGTPPRPEERGWKDSISVDFGRSARIIMRFGDYTGLYPFHCHLQWHNDVGMMAQMEVSR